MRNGEINPLAGKFPRGLPKYLMVGGGGGSGLEKVQSLKIVNTTCKTSGKTNIGIFYFLIKRINVKLLICRKLPSTPQSR